MNISAIIVNYYNVSLLEGVLTDLVCHPAMDKIYIVDNSDDVDKGILNNCAGFDNSGGGSRIEILKPGKNIGFGAGVNLAAEKIRTRFVLIVNPDVRLLNGCIDNLLEAALDNNAVLTGPRFFWDDKKTFRLPPSQGTSSWMDFALTSAQSNRLDAEHLSFYWQIRHQRFWQMNEPFIEFFLSGACVLIDRKWAFKNNNAVFDKRFFLYFEDNDISVRAMYDGHPPLCVPAAEALHYYAQSPEPEKGKVSLLETSHREFKKKYYGNIKYLPKIFGKSDSGFNRSEPEPEDKGNLINNPCFDLKGLHPCGQLYFEIGINSVFIPFVQADIVHTMRRRRFDEELFVMPDDIWRKLSKGIYYSRIRDTIKGILKVWKWQKI